MLLSSAKYAGQITPEGNVDNIFLGSIKCNMRDEGEIIPH
jgi:hypothetical protein